MPDVALSFPACRALRRSNFTDADTMASKPRNQFAAAMLIAEAMEQQLCRISLNG